jgi:protein involved in polysaccharide export with SLBB domain
MHAGIVRGKLRRLLLFVLLVGPGCSGRQSQLENALLADRNPAAHGGEAALEYQVHCPDLVEVQATDERCSGSRRIEADGCLAVGDGSRIRIDGLTPPQAAAAIARQAGLPAGSVQVRVAEFNSQFVYLHGEVTGQQRAFPYRGPETVLDLLQRAGGLTPGAAPGDVDVIRTHIAEGKTPEIFHIDLEAILLRKDQHSNITLEPFDQVYVGESRPCRMLACVPPWLKPIFEALCGMRRSAGATHEPPPAAAPDAAPP